MLATIKKTVALVLTAALIAGFFPVTASAADPVEPKNQMQIDSPGGDTKFKTGTGDFKDAKVTFDKTLEGTNNENEFIITLKATSTEKITISSEGVKPSIYVALVLDRSGSMNLFDNVGEGKGDFVRAIKKSEWNGYWWVTRLYYEVEEGTGDYNKKSDDSFEPATNGNYKRTSTSGGTDTTTVGQYVSDNNSNGYTYVYVGAGKGDYVQYYAELKKAAVNFVNDLAANTNISAAYISLASYGASATTVKLNSQYYLDIKNSTNLTTVVNAIKGTKVLTNDRSTNIAGGLQLAYNLTKNFKDTDKKVVDSYNVVLMTDGQENIFLNGYSDSLDTITGDADYTKKMADVKSNFDTNNSNHGINLLGVYYDTDNGKGITAFTNLVGEANLYASTSETSIGDIFGQTVENIIAGIFGINTITDKMGKYISYQGLYGTPTGGETNVAYDGKGLLTWNVHKITAITPVAGVYTYELKYKIKLDVDAIIADDKNASTVVDTNEYAKLKFYFTTETGGVTKEIFDGTLEAASPKVHGYKADLSFTKTDETGETLTGAGFKLNNGTENKGVEGAFTFSNLTAGSYTLTESTVPTGYTAIDPINFTVSYGKIYKGDVEWNPGTIANSPETVAYTVEHYYKTFDYGTVLADITIAGFEGVAATPGTGGNVAHNTVVSVDEVKVLDGHTFFTADPTDSLTVTKGGNNVIKLYYYKIAAAGDVNYTINTYYTYEIDGVEQYANSLVQHNGGSGLPGTPASADPADYTTHNGKTFGYVRGDTTITLSLDGDNVINLYYYLEETTQTTNPPTPEYYQLTVTHINRDTGATLYSNRQVLESGATWNESIPEYDGLAYDGRTGDPLSGTVTNYSIDITLYYVGEEEIDTTVPMTEMTTEEETTEEEYPEEEITTAPALAELPDTGVLALPVDPAWTLGSLAILASLGIVIKSRKKEDGDN